MRSLRLLAVASLLAGCGVAGVGSVGALLGRDNDTRALYVRDAPEGFPAARAGLLAGDQIVMIDGLYVRDLTTAQIHARLQGDVGSTVELTVLRGELVEHLRVEREPLRARHGVRPREEKLSE